MKQKITLLVPVEALPAEGHDDAPEFKRANGTPTRRELLNHYIEIMGESDFGFRVSAEAGIAPASETSPAPRFQYFDYAANGEAPHFEPASSFCDMDLDEILLAADHLPPMESEDATAAYVQLFAERFQNALKKAARGFAGEKLPVLRWAPAKDGDGVIVQFLGVLLADEDALTEFRGNGNNDGDGLDLILEAAEIEGRGLREIALSLGILGLVAGGTTTSAQAGFLEDLFGGGKEQKTTQVTNAHHRQADAKVSNRLLAQAATGHTEIIVDVGSQRAFLLVNGQIAVDTPVSTARAGKHTPRGEFQITQRVRTGKTSTIYGCALPCWMRLDQSAIGMHVGDLPGYPASAGCVRLPANIAPVIFDHTKSGTTVRVVDHWQPAPHMYAQADTGGGLFGNKG